MPRTIQAADGHEVAHVWERAGGPHCVLLLHGISSEKNEGGLYSALARQLSAAGLSSLRIDFRGHGDSSVPSTRATIMGMCLDLDAAYQVLAADYDQISVVAASFGASILLLRASLGDLTFRHSLWLNPVTDYKTTFTEANTPWAPSFLRQGDFSIAVNAEPVPVGSSGFLIGAQMVAELYLLPLNLIHWQSSQDLLLIHGEQDEVVNVEDSRGFIRDRVLVRAEEWYPADAGHGLDACREGVLARAVTFISASATTAA